MSGNRDTHWCYQCMQSVRLRGLNSVCPYCSGGFVQELNEVVVNEQPDFGLIHEHGAAENMFMDPYAESVNNLVDAFAELRRIRMAGTRSSSAGSSANDIFEIIMNRMRMDSGAFSDSNFFTDSELQEFVERIVASDGSQGPPPATRSAIDSLPTIRITNTHLNTDSQCPICQDKFELGCEARMMPCSHMYHSGCIVPWLSEHNSCPVCRLELPPQGTSSRQSQGRRNRLSFLWPFGS
uniref:E3 ubiquitin-protein ligase RZF1-like n=1 Tax=Erigeron canadensis TaxID=72917 RepID=UPI001CB98D1A|nr:E3 ubiquitin-protein ligase RZF1-like [Erigeron canadensis]